MNLLGWILFVFIAHSALYLILGTDNWLGTAIMATVVWAAALYAIRYLIRQRHKERT